MAASPSKQTRLDARATAEAGRREGEERHPRQRELRVIATFLRKAAYMDERARFAPPRSRSATPSVLNVAGVGRLRRAP